MGIGAVAGGLLGAASHEGTKDRTVRRYGELMGLSGDPKFQAALEKGKQWSLSGEDTWDLGDDKAAAPIEGMTNSFGVIKALGPDFITKLDQAKRNKVVEALVNEDLVNSKQGEYLVDNQARAKELINQVLGENWAAGGAFDSSGRRIRDWQPGDQVFGGRGGRGRDREW